ncbi:hypothetical protein Pla175_47360 [Pirellulimonas nuda]|uniref:Uncharacterized protein n=1 Tax=Pirellulimonas nuda TaxID=2528009 RepID=A0A518DIL8_9BACT|nr:hypothetical protein [Pirellulimonas nuda]QDU91315.1 hypothetical protein Pla175_47360 [Pirellulimonas nuda]
MAAPQYEFNEEQNSLFRSLGGKMGGVGLVMVVVGLLNLVAAGMLVAAIYRNELPADWVNKLPVEAKNQLATLPPNQQLMPFAINAGLQGLVFFLLGIWTRSAAGSFRKVAGTQGNDVSWLMSALGALNKAYGLIYTLIMLTVLLTLALVGYNVYQQMQKDGKVNIEEVLKVPEAPKFDGGAPADDPGADPAADPAPQPEAEPAA